MRPALLADVFEAFIGALYLDQGYELLSQISWIQSFFRKLEIGAFSHVMDYKSQLQEIIQQSNNGTLSTKLLRKRSST